MSGPVPKQSAERCSLRSLVRGDPLLGTAFPAGRLLLVEQPGAWGPDGLTESDFEHRLAHELKDRVKAAGMRLQTIRRPGRDTGHGERRWALADCREGRESVRWGTFTHDRDLTDLPLDGSAGTVDDEPTYLVCTHGRHDPCCALLGRPTAAALAELRPGRVWETSHLGGDRFAANVLVLPSGLLYGRVDVSDVEQFVATAEAGEVDLDRLRGRVGLAPPVQAALAFGHRQLGIGRGLRVRSVTAGEDGGTTVELDGADGPVAVRVRTEAVPAAGLTCHNPRANRFLIFHAELLD